MSKKTKRNAKGELMMNLETLIMWLATIDDNEVGEEQRPEIIKYQADCMAILTKAYRERRLNLPKCVGKVPRYKAVNPKDIKPPAKPN